jgi:hypothetical protein
MDPDQTARMRRLFWIHASRKCTMLALSRRGSFHDDGFAVYSTKASSFFLHYFKVMI